jgi:hypothetical protein
MKVLKYAYTETVKYYVRISVPDDCVEEVREAENDGAFNTEKLKDRELTFNGNFKLPSGAEVDSVSPAYYSDCEWHDLGVEDA